MENLDREGRDFIFYLIAGKKTEEAIAAIKLCNNINLTDKKGYTYLQFAAMYGEEQVLKLLLEKGAEIDHINKNGLTALCLAVNLRKKNKNSNKNVVKLLFDAGADADYKANKDILSPREYVKLFNDKILAEIFENK